jgi:hypothetical protein
MAPASNQTNPTPPVSDVPPMEKQVQ